MKFLLKKIWLNIIFACYIMDGFHQKEVPKHIMNFTEKLKMLKKFKFFKENINQLVDALIKLRKKLMRKC